jgi:hypothetical protein
MTKFTTDSENGKTYFIDCKKAYDALPEEWKMFLDVCKINNPNTATDENLDDFSPVVNHWIDGRLLLRLAPRKNKDSGTTLRSVYDREPTELEKTLFEEIFNWFGNYVYDNEEERIVHKWEQGDLLIVDIFKLAHAVTGGFNVAVGASTGAALTTGATNTFIGHASGAVVQTGSSNICIGSNSQVSGIAISNELVIGSNGQFVATNGAAATYFATATAGAVALPVASLGFIRINLNGSFVKIPVYGN